MWYEKRTSQRVDLLQVRYIQNKVSKVVPAAEEEEGGIITLADGTTFTYDWLVLALGADTNLGVSQHTAHC
jgi:NADH dehydrogenase FAD-containing subunit